MTDKVRIQDMYNKKVIDWEVMMDAAPPRPRPTASYDDARKCTRCAGQGYRFDKWYVDHSRCWECSGTGVKSKKAEEAYKTWHAFVAKVDPLERIYR